MTAFVMTIFKLISRYTQTQIKSARQKKEENHFFLSFPFSFFHTRTSAFAKDLASFLLHFFLPFFHTSTSAFAKDLASFSLVFFIFFAFSFFLSHTRKSS
jgi:hypothetical protein